ncbi:MAG: hypothetical protein ACLQU3_24735 [Limisphaerales bacterium]
MKRNCCLALLTVWSGSVLQAEESQIPAVLFAGADGGACGYEVANRLVRAGFALGADHASLSEHPLAWSQLTNYNVVVLSGLGLANADMSLGRTRETIDVLNRYLEAGGGVLMLGAFGQMATIKPPQDAFLKPLGLTPLFDEMPDDPKTAVTATAWELPFAVTKNIAESPVSSGVKSLWYPVPRTRVGGQNHSIPFLADSSWQIVICGSASSLTYKGALQESRPDQSGTYHERVPLMAMRSVGKGRIMYFGITPEYLLGPNANSTLEGIVLDKGLKGTPSHGFTLLVNGLRWLAGVSLDAGLLGGAKTEEPLLRNPNKVRFSEPYRWPEKVGFAQPELLLPGVVGPRTSYSSGRAVVDQWVEKAKASGLAWIVFLEDFASLPNENFRKLKADCARLSSAQFEAVPGFTIDDEVGNHYFYFGTSFPYPDAKFLTSDGKRLRSRDAELNARQPYIPGQLAMTTLDYSYSISSFKLTAGNYLFKQGAAPFADFFSDYDAMGVVTARNGELIEDASQDYLKLCASGQTPVPLVIDLMDDPGQIGKSRWRTILTLSERGGGIIGGTLAPGSKVRDYFDIWHTYPDNPVKPQVTSGPRIDTWSHTGPRDYEGSSPGDFVWQNYRWVVHGKASSPAGLTEVTVYDGPHLFRRFLPQGKPEFEFSLDLTHDRQHCLVVVATDKDGGRAVSGDQWDRNHRAEEFMCGDRNNQLTYGYVINHDGIGILLGGNQTLGTTIKRISCGISPSGTFKNDRLLGAPAFDGAAGGEPEVWENTIPISPAHEAPNPVVTEARRLLITRDVMIGDGPREYCFADNIPVHNVWHTLWRTQPVREYRVNRRNHFFQIDPDSPLAVFLWQIDIAMKEDLPNQGFQVAVLQSRRSCSWAVRTDAGTLRTGQWDQPEDADQPVSSRFGLNSYAAFLDSPLGGAAVFSLTDGLIMRTSLPKRGDVQIIVPTEAAPQRKGEAKQVNLLIVGVPRRCALTENWPPSKEVVERFYRDFALDGGKGGYAVRLDQGTVLSRRYILSIDGRPDGGMSGQLEGRLISSLPIAVSGLNDRWSAFLYDRQLKKSRPVGVLEGKAWATINLAGKADLFVGHPVLVDNPDLFVQLTQSGEQTWTLEIHNPTDAAITTRIRAHPDFDPLKGKAVPTGPMVIPPGESWIGKY